MKRKILLPFVMGVLITGLHAQNNQKITGYAITAPEKGQRNWKEVRQLDITTGEAVKSVYQTTSDIEILNARTGKPVVKKDIEGGTTIVTKTLEPTQQKKVVNLDQELNKADPTNHPMVHRIVIVSPKVQTDRPFATNSAAMAYDKKHDRLYYTPMGINQLRYIDLKSNKIYYFEDEPFGKVSGLGDGANQITRMVIASDGNGYALTNDGNHLLRFTTGKNPEITDLGALTDDGADELHSVHMSRGYGGDMIADASENLYLVTANRNVFKINIASKSASYKGAIQGLPQGFSTNGAMVEEGSKVIVCSAESTEGYYRFDLNTLQAEKVSTQGEVFNASDLANGNLAFEKEKKKKKEEKAEEVKEETVVPPVVAETTTAKQPLNDEASLKPNAINIYPNPVTNGTVKLSFADQPAGKYQIQLLDLSGKMISSKEVTISGNMQTVDFRLPDVAGKGNYFLKISSESNKVSVVNKLVVQ